MLSSSRFALELCVFIILGVICILINVLATPFKQGFFMNDETIRYPYKEDTINYLLVVISVAIVPAGVIFLLELGIHMRLGSSYYQSEGIQISPSYIIPGWILDTLYIIGIHFGGMIVTQLSTDIPQYLIGRLRPHFLEVCQPAKDKINEESMEYVNMDVCTGDPAKIMRAQKSFPSGHSSMAMYGAGSGILFLIHRCKPWPLSRLPVLLSTFILFYLAVAVALTRVSDYKHHWSDVLAGSIIGFAIAFLIKTVYCIGDVEEIEYVTKNVTKSETTKNEEKEEPK